MSGRILILVGTVCLATGSLADLAPPDTTDTALPVELNEEFFDRIDELGCTDLNAFAYREIPRYVLFDRPDLLYEFVLYWEDRCLTTEPVFRIKVLGSIWDAAFDEGLYGEEVLERLIERYDPPVKSKHPDLRASYDAFTASFADQLLPHVPRAGLEEFFCLYYGGETDQAWKLLNSPELEDTWLRYYYDEEVGYLTRTNSVPTLAVTGGGWWPSGNLDFVGDKPLVGLLTGVRWPSWLVRFVLEVRVGRSDEPYWVDEDGYFGRSNRFDAVLIGGEFGRIIFKSGPHNIDLFAGIGFDAVKPFYEEDFMLATANANLGAGYRFFAGKDRNWILGADIRHEWIGDRNENTDSMSGTAWSVRISLGYAFNEGRERRLESLGR
jgi:hypothetical protein